VDDLVEWLCGQLDEDERVAREAMRENPLGLVLCLHLPPEAQQHNARHDPARTLREVEAKRKILALTRFNAQFPDFEGGYDSACEDVIKLLAEPLADRPGYQEEWRP
jgi:hypothetical protein